MQTHGRSSAPRAALGVAVAVLVALAPLARPAAAQGPWRQLADPVAAGWDEAGVAAARQLAENGGSAAVVVVDRGVIAHAWGEVERKFKCHSVRKSILSLLYGIAVERGLVDLEATVGALGIDDRSALSDVEKSARIIDLLAARSGVYHPAAKEPNDMKRRRPARFSQRPDERFFYNNWDFNVAGVVLAQQTGKDLFATFDEWLAKPLGLEDWQSDDGRYELEPGNSEHAAFAFRMSARDLARIGWLVSNDGRVGERAVVPAAWIERSTGLVSRFQNDSGYGLMWWCYPAGSLASAPRLNEHDVVLARGTGGQAVFVVRGQDFVVVHRGDTDNGQRVGGGTVFGIVEAMFAARPAAAPARELSTEGIVATPLPGRLPRRPERSAVASTAAERAEVAGVYRFPRLGRCRVFEHDDRLFVHAAPGNETELVRVRADDGPDGEDGASWIAAVDGGAMTPERGANGRVVAVTVEVGGRALRGERVPPDGELWVVHIDEGGVRQVDLTTGIASDLIATGREPHEIALCPDGRRAVVADYGGSRLAIVDLDARAVERQIPLARDPVPAFSRPHGVAVNDDGTALVTAEANQRLLRVDLQRGVVEAAMPTAARMSHMVLPFDDGARALVANKSDGDLTVVEVALGEVVQKIATGAGAQGLALRPGTREVWVTNIEADSLSIVDLDSLTEIAELPCPDHPVRVAFSPDGSRAIVSHYRPGTVSIWGAAARRLRIELPLPRLTNEAAAARPLPAHRRGFPVTTPLPVGLLVHPDGETAFVACTRGDQVIEIDLAFEIVGRRFATGRAPDGMIWRR